MDSDKIKALRKKYKAQPKQMMVFQELYNAGATLEKKEDRYGNTKTGWWMDDVWLAPTNKPGDALRALQGS